MNETVTKRFLLYFRLMLLVWILIANAVIHLTGMEYSWLIFLSNIMSSRWRLTIKSQAPK